MSLLRIYPIYCNDKGGTSRQISFFLLHYGAVSVYGVVGVCGMQEKGIQSNILEYSFLRSFIAVQRTVLLPEERFKAIWAAVYERSFLS